MKMLYSPAQTITKLLFWPRLYQIAIIRFLKLLNFLILTTPKRNHTVIIANFGIIHWIPIPIRNLSPYEYWFANSLSPRAETKYQYNNWIKRGRPQRRNFNSANTQLNSSLVETLLRAVKELMSSPSVNKSSNSNYALCDSSESPINFNSAILATPLENKMSDFWIFDTGASTTSTWNKSAFIPGTLKMFNKPKGIRVGDGSIIKVQGAGDIELKIIIKSYTTLGGFLN